MKAAAQIVMLLVLAGCSTVGHRSHREGTALSAEYWHKPPCLSATDSQLYAPKHLDNKILALILTESHPDGTFMVVYPKAEFDLNPTDAQHMKDWFRSASTTRDVALVVDRLFERNKMSGTRQAVQLSLPSSAKDGYVVDYDGKYRKYFQNDGGGWPRFYEENPKAMGKIGVSLPAYDEKTGLVLVYKRTAEHGLQGKGEVILYSFRNGKLTKLSTLPLWKA